MNPELPLISLILGVVFILKHLFSLIWPDSFKSFLKKFPRSRPIGLSLLAIAVVWAFFITTTTDLGEFSSLRASLLIGIVIGGILFGWLVPEFLAVRSLGFILLLLAHPILEVTFLKSGLLSIMVSVIVYVWVIAGLFMVGMPYLLRNLFSFISGPAQRRLWNNLAYVGLAYGIVLIAAAILQLL